VDRTTRQVRTLTLMWAAIAEITLTGTIYIWWECDPTGVTRHYGRGAPTAVLAIAMAATVVGSLPAARPSGYHRGLRIAIGISVAAAAAAPASLTLWDVISPSPTGTYLLLVQATIGMGVVATSAMRTHATTNHSTGRSPRLGATGSKRHLVPPDDGQPPTERRPSDQTITRAER
jgi:hypothetical protein